MAKNAFRTRKGDPPVEIGNVGIVDQNGLALKRAALAMPELQDDSGQPLSGAPLVNAAEKWAATVDLDVVQIKLDDEDDQAAAAAAAKPAADHGHTDRKGDDS